MSHVVFLGLAELVPFQDRVAFREHWMTENTMAAREFAVLRAGDKPTTRLGISNLGQRPASRAVLRLGRRVLLAHRFP